MKDDRRLENAFYDLLDETDNLKDRLAQEFKLGKTLKWPVVPKAQLHRVWLGFSRHSHVQDERALDSILASFRSSLAHLTCATTVAGHTPQDPMLFMEEQLDEDELERFTTGLIEDGSGWWRISDYALAPLTRTIAMAMAEIRPNKRLVLLDRALNIVHARSDLSRLFVEGGRDAWLSVSLEEQGT